MSGRGTAREAVLGVLRSGALGVVLHPLWSVTAVLCLVAVLAPLLVGIGIARGVSDASLASLADGPDLTVSATRFGRPAPLPASAVAAIAAVPGVRSAEPRVTGSVALGLRREPVVVVGMPAARFAGPAGDGACSAGRLPRGPFEAALGPALAARLGLGEGDAIPPFYRNRAGEKVTLVTGVLREDGPMWQAHVMLVTLETAQAYFDEESAVTTVAVRCEPEYREAVRAAVLRIPSLAPPGDAAAPPLVVAREDAEARVARALTLREGGLAAWLGLAIAAGIPVMLVATGLGLSARRQETGLLRAVGWRADEIVLRSLAESAVLAALGWSAAVLAAWAWARLLGGAGISALLVPDAGLLPAARIPVRLAPEALVAAAAAAVALVSTGTIVTAWRAAAAEPTEAMR